MAIYKLYYTVLVMPGQFTRYPSCRCLGESIKALNQRVTEFVDQRIIMAIGSYWNNGNH